MSQKFNTTVNNWTSPDTAANAYSRFVSTVAENTVTALRNTNNFIFSSLDAWRSTLQQARDNLKQIFDLNTKTAKTFEQNAIVNKSSSGCSITKQQCIIQQQKRMRRQYKHILYHYYPCWFNIINNFNI